MKDNKQILTTIVVAVIIAIIASIITGMVMSRSADLSPRYVKDINAHRCQGSEISSEVITKVLDLAKFGRGIHLKEGEKVYRNEFFVIPEEFYEVTSIYNSTMDFADDYVILKEVITGKEREFKATSEGKITGVTMGGKTYTIMYRGASTSPEEDRWIEIEYSQTADHAMMDLSICF
ncbi:hypothetical protein J4462_00545 [Candidatus Pacearchaeota archaeon]|nr:hypothetical protein [Candidatus Pacearchaeota archaeon]